MLPSNMPGKNQDDCFILYYYNIIPSSFRRSFVKLTDFKKFLLPNIQT